MALKFKQGCLIEAAKNGEVNVIAHQCNCWNNMGSGIAPQIAKAFPSAWEADQATVRGDRSKLGTFTLGVDTTHKVTVFNLYGQFRYGKGVHTNYFFLKKALIAMQQALQKETNRIGFPRIGCGLGGGEWEIVGKMIEDVFHGYDVTIYDKA